MLTGERGAQAPFSFLAALLLAGCVATPKVVEYYDEGCSIQTRKVVLQTQPLGNLSCTQSSDCMAVVLTISASTAIVSGSIVVIGNTAYWLERVGKCIARIPGN